MMNLRVIEVVDYLDDGKVSVVLDGKKYIRKVIEFDGSNLIRLNNQEFLVRGF